MMRKSKKLSQKSRRKNPHSSRYFKHANNRHPEFSSGSQSSVIPDPDRGSRRDSRFRKNDNLDEMLKRAQHDNLLPYIKQWALFLFVFLLPTQFGKHFFF